jgi:hypothetical protein
MKKFRYPVLITLLAVFLQSVPSYAKIMETGSTIAFGYLANAGDNNNFNYLETVFPNSMANTLKNKYGFKTVKLTAVDNRLKKVEKQLEKRYEAHQVPELLEIVKTDYFLYGHFTPLPGNKVEIVINFYAGGTNRLFSFTNVGEMEAEIFKLVDRMISILQNFMTDDQLFQAENLPKGSPVGIITNVEGRDLNSIYLKFLQEGYPVHAVQAQTPYNSIDEEQLARYKHIYTKRTSYDIATDRKSVNFLYGTWTGKRYDERLEYIRSVYKLYDLNYESTKDQILKKITDRYQIKYLIIISFDKSKKSAWIRCINLQKNELVWMQSGIEGDDVEGITGEIISSFQREIKLTGK